MAADGAAIIGWSCRLPGAESVDALRALVARGGSGVVALGDADEAPDAARAAPGYVAYAGHLGDVSRFDPLPFGLSDDEATHLDPQQRLLLLTAAEALDDAAIDPSRIDGRIGVFAATELSQYLALHLLPRLAGPLDPRWFPTVIANDKDFAAAQIAYRLDLRGPAYGVQAGCASGMIALHAAVQSLLAGECDVAVAAAAAVRLPQAAGYVAAPGGPFSADGRTRSYDARGTGTVYGSGAVALVLRRVDDARDDRAHAIVAATAVYSDGRARPGFAAPSADGHALVLAEVLGVAGIDPAEVGYVEGNGTATVTGDGVEIAGIREALGGAEVALGSVRATIGHVQAASGLAGVLHAALAMAARELPGVPGFEVPNPALGGRGPRPSAQPRPWPADRPAALVNSFAVGGAHAAAVLLPAPPPAPAAAGPLRLQITAADDDALRARARALADALDARPAEASAIVATASRLRRHLARHVAEAADARALARDLRAWAGSGAPPVAGSPEPVARGPVTTLPPYPWRLRRMWIDGAAARPTDLDGLRASLRAALPPGSPVPDDDEPLAAAGLDSVRLLSWLAAIEQDAPALADALGHGGWSGLTLRQLAALSRAPGAPDAAPPDGFSIERLAVGWAALRAWVGGEGPVTVLVPPLGCGASAWRPALTALTGLAARVIAVDPPGFRGAPDAPWPDALVELARSRGPIDLIGWSLGGCVAIEVALSAPEAVRSLTLVASSARPLRRPSFGALARLAAAVDAAAPDELREPAARAGWIVDRALARAQGERLLTLDLRARLGELRLPVTVVTGDLDAVLPEAHGRELAELIPGARRARVADAGHLLPATHPAALVAALHAAERPA